MSSDDKKVVSLKDARPDKEAALEILDDIEQMINDGELKAFSAIAIEPGGNLRIYVAKVLPCTRLEMVGAISVLLNEYHNGVDLGE
jgi:hypothetical protein